MNRSSDARLMRAILGSRHPHRLGTPTWSGPLVCRVPTMLLAREPERQALEQLLSGARNGRSGVLALVGEPGIGKTSLLDLAVELAGGMRVLRARGVASEAQIPFAALFELLRPALDRLDAI